MIYYHKEMYRVRASVNPTNRIIAKRARDSSGRVPLYGLFNTLELINFSDAVFDRVKMNGFDRSDRVRKEVGGVHSFDRVRKVEGR